MTRNVIVASILSLAVVSATGEQITDHAAVEGKPYTAAQLRQLEQEAQLPDQYKALASYYGQEQGKYLQLAAEEKQEWNRRSQNIVGSAAKYPRPVDSARYLYEYYMYKASESESLEAKYNRLAPAVSPVNAQ